MQAGIRRVVLDVVLDSLGGIWEHGNVGLDAVERQVEAYNAHDLDAFVACYAEAVLIEDAEGAILVSGRDEVRALYLKLFDGSPDLHAEILSRIRVGSYVVDEESVTGGPARELHAVAVYRLNDEGLIDRVLFLR